MLRSDQYFFFFLSIIFVINPICIRVLCNEREGVSAICNYTKCMAFLRKSDEYRYVNERELEKLLQDEETSFLAILIKELSEGRTYYGLDRIVRACTTEQRDILIPAVAEDIKKNGYSYGKYSSSSLFAYCTEEQKEIFLSGFLDRLRRGDVNNELDSIFKKSTPKQRNVLISIIAKGLKQGRCYWWVIGEISKSCTEEQRDLLIQGALEGLSKGYDYDGNLFWLFQACSEKQEELFFLVIVEGLEKGYDYGGALRLMFERFSNARKDLLVKKIQHNLKNGCNYQNFPAIFECCNENQKNILLNGIEEGIGLGHSYEWISRIFLFCNERQRDFLVPEIANELKRGIDYGENLVGIFKKCSEKQKEILIKRIVEGLIQGTEYKNLGQIFINCNEDQEMALLNGIGKSLAKGNDCICLGDIFNHGTKEQKTVLNAIIFENLKLGDMALKFLIEEGCSLTGQTISHLLVNLWNIKSSLSKVLNEDQQALNVFLRTIKSEQEILKHRSKNKQYVFYHAQRWEWYWLEILYTKLWEAKYKKEAKSYLFTRFPQDSSCLSNGKNQFSKKKIRKQLIKAGGSGGYCQSLLFLNYALFGNVTGIGSCSASLFLKNCNHSKPTLIMQTIFNQFGLDRYYQQHKEKLEMLEQQFIGLSLEHGNLMQIVMTGKYLKKNVFLAGPGGYHTKALLENEKTDDVATIIETLKTDPTQIDDSDRKEFCWVVTDDSVYKALEAGVQIRNFNTADPERFAEVMSQLGNIVHDIAEQARTDDPEFDCPAPRECYQQYKAYNKRLDAITSDTLQAIRNHT